ncbi:MAG: ACT domain-containing protein [Clostridiales bacterium]|nr:ACT domain-containing protein [Clostridiales bacterium]
MKCVLTVIGKDKPGIIAKVSTLLANNNVNIEDISQTIMQSTFTMIMLVNISNSGVTMQELKENLKELGEEIGVSIHLQHEDVFDAMHRV